MRSGVRGREADLVVASVGGGECKTPGEAALLRDDAVVVIEYFLWDQLVFVLGLDAGRKDNLSRAAEG